MLEIENLNVLVEDNPILQGINLKINAGEVHAIMGPNGSGKSTLAKVVSGHPSYQISSGRILYKINNQMTDLSPLEPYERALEGIFMGHQYPIEISGISNYEFLKESFNSVCQHSGANIMNDKEFRTFLEKKLEILEMSSQFLDRSLNEGFSGGEKKKNEILQMAVLNPKLAFLDETDSGLDIDALKIVAKGVNSLKSKYNAIVLVTHYQRLLDYIVPDYVHVLYQGRIVKSSDSSLAHKLEKEGYDWLIK